MQSRHRVQRQSGPATLPSPSSRRAPYRQTRAQAPHPVQCPFRRRRHGERRASRLAVIPSGQMPQQYTGMPSFRLSQRAQGNRASPSASAKTRAQGKTLDLLIRLTDTQEGWELHLANSVLTARRADHDRRAPLLTCTRLQMMALFEGRLTPEQAVQQGLLQNAAPVKELLSLLDSFRPDFQLVLP